jgi:CRP-like cAMP-binding protein
VCKVGDAGDSMYFVISGSLSVSLGDHELEVLHAGQCFGEGAMLSLVKSLDSGLRKVGASPSLNAKR